MLHYWSSQPAATPCSSGGGRGPTSEIELQLWVFCVQTCFMCPRTCPLFTWGPPLQKLHWNLVQANTTKLGNNTHSYSTSTKLSMKVRNITIQLTFCCLPSVLPVGDLGKSEVWISFQIYIISQTILNLTLKGQKRKTAKKDDQEPARTCSLIIVL